MRPRFESSGSLRLAALPLVALGVCACGSPAAPDAGAQATRDSATDAATRAAGLAPDPSGGAAAGPDAAGAAATPALVGRNREMLNPDETSMVLLYFDLAGIAPRIDDWVEQDPAVQYAPGADKAGKRATRKAELQGAVASVHDIGALRLTLDANLSPYDPTYNEFTVRALAPSSVIRYAALGQNVEVNFTNGLAAQTWKVPAAEAQAIQDQLSGYRRVSLDVLLRITGVQPAPGGGTVMTEVVEYEMRDGQTGATLARVRIPGERS